MKLFIPFLLYSCFGLSLFIESEMSKAGVGLSKMFAGRNSESLVWNYFKYDVTTNKSVCLAKKDISNVDGAINQCGFQLAGKNATNLKVS